MLNVFTCKDGRPKRIPDPHDQAALRNAVWIDLLSPTQREAAQVADASGLAVPSQADLSEIEGSSRLATRNGALYLSLPLVSMADGPRSVAAGFVLSPDRLLTIPLRAQPVIRRLRRTCGARRDRIPTQCAHPGRPAGGDRRPPGQHAGAGSCRSRPDLPPHLRHRRGADQRTQEGGRAAAPDRRHARPNRRSDLACPREAGRRRAHRALRGIHRRGLAAEGTGTAAGDAAGDIASVSDFDTQLNDKLQFLLDATLGFINIAQNNVMKVLIVVSIVGIPPTLVAGIYGINFKGMPEYDWAWGYPYCLTVIAVSAILPLMVRRRRGWV